MDKLSQLYFKYNNFTAYRNETLAEIDENNDDLRIQIQELELEKKQAQLEFEKKIHALKSQMNTTRAKARANEELTQEKKDLKDELHSEIAKVYEHGKSPRDIANHLGLNSTTLIYQAVNSKKVVAGEESEVTIDAEWTYFDNAAIHRYAISDDRQYVKVHGSEDAFKIVTVDGLRFVSGEKDIKLNSKRINIALQMARGEDIGKFIERPNPYREKM